MQDNGGVGEERRGGQRAFTLLPCILCAFNFNDEKVPPLSLISSTIYQSDVLKKCCIFLG